MTEATEVSRGSDHHFKLLPNGSWENPGFFVYLLIFWKFEMVSEFQKIII